MRELQLEGSCLYQTDLGSNGFDPIYIVHMLKILFPLSSNILYLTDNKIGGTRRIEYLNTNLVPTQKICVEMQKRYKKLKSYLL